MDSASHPSDNAAPDPAESPGKGRHAADPLADLFGQIASAWQALRTHIALLIDDGIGRFYGLLVTTAMVLTGLSIVVLMMTLGCYYLVSGIALGLTELVGSAWIGRTCAGAIFLVGPVLIGYGVMAGRRRARERRIVNAYQHLQDQEQRLERRAVAP